MPFTLAHPAVALPLRSLCPDAFVALVVGSIAPDLPYFLPSQLGARLPSAHSALGTLTVSLPLGCALLAALVLGRSLLTAPLWEPHSRRLLAALEGIRRAPRAWALAVPGVMAGIWLHVGWDSFTHRTGVATLHLPLLSATWSVWPGYHVEGFRLLQYASSAVGVFALIGWYARRHRGGGATDRDERPGWRSWALLGLYVASWAWGALQVRRIGIRNTSIHGATYVAVTAELACFAVLYCLLALGIRAAERVRRARVGGPAAAGAAPQRPAA